MKIKILIAIRYLPIFCRIYHLGVRFNGRGGIRLVIGAERWIFGRRVFSPLVSRQSRFHSRRKKDRSAQPVTFSAGAGEEGGGVGSDPSVYKSCIPQYTLVRAAFGLMSTAENETSTNGGSSPPSFLPFNPEYLPFRIYIFNARSPLTETISRTYTPTSPNFLIRRFSSQFYI